MASLNIIVPCYNPPEGWDKALIARFNAFCTEAGALGLEMNLIVVDDGSIRNTGASRFSALEQSIPGARIVHYSGNRGKGHALRQGVAASTAEFHLVTDIDFPYTGQSMTRVIQTVQKNGGIAAGSRDTSYYARVPAFRRRLSRMLRWLLRNMLRQPIDDSQCGLKAFDDRGKTVFLETTIDRFLFDLEFLMLANGRVPVTPVPVELREGIVFSKVGWSVLAAEGGNLLRLLFRSSILKAKRL